MPAMTTVNQPAHFPGTPEQIAANRATHNFAQDEDARCVDCDCRSWGITAEWPCGTEPPREDVPIHSYTRALQAALDELGITADDPDEDEDPFTEALSSNGYSLDQQAADALTWLRLHYPLHAESVDNDFPPDDAIWSGSWLDTEAMKVDSEYGSWLVDAIEATGVVCWEEGEPWGDPSAEDAATEGES